MGEIRIASTQMSVTHLAADRNLARHSPDFRFRYVLVPDSLPKAASTASPAGQAILADLKQTFSHASVQSWFQLRKQPTGTNAELHSRT